MPFLNDEFLRKAQIILYHDSSSNRLLPYCKIRPYDSVSGYDTNSEYYAPLRLSAGIADKNEMPFQVVIHERSDGAFPFDQHKGQATGTVTLHQYTDI